MYFDEIKIHFLTKYFIFALFIRFATLRLRCLRQLRSASLRSGLFPERLSKSIQNSSKFCSVQQTHMLTHIWKHPPHIARAIFSIVAWHLLHLLLGAELIFRENARASNTPKLSRNCGGICKIVESLECRSAS